jgi:hypothetical protein
MRDLIYLARITVGRNFSADEWRLYFPGENYRKTFDELPSADENIGAVSADRATMIIEIAVAPRNNYHPILSFQKENR